MNKHTFHASNITYKVVLLLFTQNIYRLNQVGHYNRLFCFQAGLLLLFLDSLNQSLQFVAVLNYFFIRPNNQAGVILFHSFKANPSCLVI